MAEDCVKTKNVASAKVTKSSGGSLSSTLSATTNVAGSTAPTDSNAKESTTATSASKESTTSKNLNDYLDDFISSVERGFGLSELNDTVDTINGVDCSDEVYKFLAANVPGFSTAMGWMNKVVDGVHGILSGTTISTAVSGADFTKSVCDALVMFYGTVNGYIEVFTKGAFVFFKKIDALRLRLENALLNLTDAIKFCILDVLNDLLAKIKAVVKLSLTVDWDALLKLMIDCPCLTKVVATLTNCTRDADGNDISNDAYAVIECIKSYLDFLNPIDICVGLEALYESYVRKYVEIVFGYIGSWIVYVFKMIIKPFRYAIKKYAEMLMFKMDVTAFIEMVGPFECFFVYTDEYKSGNKYKGMSIIDMINTFRRWIPCFEHACPSFSEKVKNRSKEIYMDLRLDDKYWRNAFEIDLYTTCIGAKLGGSNARETTLRSLYNESPWDLIMTWYRHNSNKNKGDAETNPVPDSELMATEADIAEYQASHGGKNPPNTPNDFSQSVKFTDAPETENEVNVGNIEISESILNYCIMIIRNLGISDDSYYTEKLYQFIRLMNVYKTSPEYVDAATESLLHTDHLRGTFGRGTPTTLTATGIRPPLDIDDTDRLATYRIDNDYDEEFVEHTEDRSVYMMTRGKNESRIDFYSRMYMAAAV